ncbi:MAG TPA: quinate 5-dehydrogenase, partial [Anaerolineae bacterium]|nr:quinate 5-dehydrogenase [Anaerolineae bacterium]
KIGDYINSKGRKVLVTLGVDRWGLSKSFVDAGYETLFGDLMFGLDIPVAVKTLSQLKTVAALFMPIAGRLPFEWIYPTGEKQEKRTPKFGKYYAWATVIAGDCHYIKRFMPDDLNGKVIVTNTTTPEDVEQFKKAGVKYLVTTTPVLEGRS